MSQHGLMSSVILCTMLLGLNASAQTIEPPRQMTDEELKADPVAAFNAQQERNAAFEKALADRDAVLAKKPAARIGMTAKQVRETTNWGEPSSVNRTMVSGHTHEQWVYGDRQYLYFDNGRLTAIQNSQ
jgi:hypothetical protein